MDILANHPEGYMRFEAAMALYDTNDPSSIPALKRALEIDTYARVRSGGCLGPRLSRNEIVYSPTRDARLVPSSAWEYRYPQVLMFLAAIGGSDAESAITRFIESKKEDVDASKMVEFARDMLEMSRAVDVSGEKLL